MDKLLLRNPVKPFWMTQVFGGNKGVYAQFGLDGHNGIDFLALHGQPVFAAHDGEAVYSIDPNNGHLIVITSDREYDMGSLGKGYIKTVYGHLCDPAKEPKFASPVWKAKNYTLKVKTGDLIAYADNTGFSTGDHLHFGFKPQKKNSKGELSNMFQTNGYKGSCDPLPFLEGVEEPKPTFTRDLYFGVTGEDVKELQKYLGSKGFKVLPSGKETTYFGTLTQNALIQFQKAKKISPPAGYFGAVTRKYIASNP